MRARNPYFNFRSLSAILRAKEHFGLIATTPEFSYPKDWEGYGLNEEDPLGFRSYMERYKPKDWATIKEQSAFILSHIGEVIKPYQDEARRVRYHWYDKDGTFNARKKIQLDADKALFSLKQSAMSLANIMAQKVQLADNAFVEISAEVKGFRVNSPYYYEKEYVLTVSKPEWILSSKLSASMPCQIDEAHPLVAGVSNDLASVDLFMPVDDPSIAVNIRRGENRNPVYLFKLKDSGVDKQLLDDMINLLLI
jgi:hypothetical protein